MRLPTLLLPLAAMLLLAACDRPATTERAPTDSLEDRAAYILGHQVGMGFHEEIGQLGERDTRIDEDVVLAGFRAGLRGDSLPYRQEEVQTTMQVFQDSVMIRAGSGARRAGRAFIEDYSRQEGVTTTESGLRYRVLEAGQGPSPTPADQVVIHYEGRLPDGEVFDSSRPRGEPVRFPVEGVVPGFSEALQLMQPGGRYEIVLPPELGYGDSPQGPGGPGQTLIFTVDLIEVIRG